MCFMVWSMGAFSLRFERKCCILASTEMPNPRGIRLSLFSPCPKPNTLVPPQYLESGFGVHYTITNIRKPQDSIGTITNIRKPQDSTNTITNIRKPQDSTDTTTNIRKPQDSIVGNYDDPGFKGP